ncbi:MAG: putative endoribonuclease [Myxococcaceae bacterium]|nr:putative endoribonuclease [Myxococcaceae bacterium]
MRSVVSTPNAPGAIGPYSQAIRAGQFVFLSGQIPLDPDSGAMVGGDDVEAQTVQVMKNLAAVLLAAGSSFGQVVKSTIFLTDLGDFAVVNRIYGAHFPSEPPARATVQVAALPRGAKVEIELTALAL